jgi:hypothetical protein
MKNLGIDDFDALQKRDARGVFRDVDEESIPAARSRDLAGIDLSSVPSEDDGGTSYTASLK